MRTLAASFKLLLLALAVAAAPARAQVLDARIAAVRSGAGSLEQVALHLEWPRDAAFGTLRLRAAKVDFPALSWVGRDADWQCRLTPAPAGRWRCDGPIRTRGGGTQRLALDFSAEAFGAELVAGRSRIAYGGAAGSADGNRVRLQKVPVAWLKDFLAGMWARGRWNAGSMDGTIEV
jgi:hypothetical protein